MTAAMMPSLGSGKTTERADVCVTSLREVVMAARDSLQATVKVPVTSIGRMQDAFARLAEEVCANVGAMAEAELAAARQALSQQAEAFEAEIARTQQAAVEAVASQQAALDVEVARLVAEKTSAACAERDSAVAEAVEREKRVRDELEALIARTSNSSAIIAESEEKLQKATAAGAKLSDKVSTLQDAAKRQKEQWSTELAETLRTCTLAADAMAASRGEVDESRPWRMRKVTEAEQMIKNVERLESPGLQLKALIAA